MYYSSIGILALLTLIIINYDVLRKARPKTEVASHKNYKRFLLSILCFYAVDILWDPLYVLKLHLLVFIDTEIYFLIMAIAVLLWMQYVLSYLNDYNKFAKILKITCCFFLCSQLVVLIINLFIPILFWFDKEGTYHTGLARNLNLLFQIILFSINSVHMLLISSRTQDKQKFRQRAIGMFSLSMTVFITLQVHFPFMPFYAIGYMLGTCLLHTFVLEDEKEARREELEKLLQIERLQEAELGSTRQMAFTDPLTGVKNKMAYMEDVSSIERRIADGIIKQFGLMIFDVNGLKIINDTKGHDEGDKYIKSACNLICHQFKHSPVYRIGGDEFAAFLDGEDYKNHDRLILEFNRNIEKNLKEGSIVISCGYAEFNPKHDRLYRSIFERADKKMYEKKRELKRSANKKLNSE